MSHFTRLGRRVAIRGLLVLMSLAPATRAGAHGANLMVSRDDARPPRLQINGRDDYLSRARCSRMIPGTDALAGYWFVDSPEIVTMPVDVPARGRLRLAPGHRLALKLVQADNGFSVVVPVTWRTVLGQAGDLYELPQAEGGNVAAHLLSRADRPDTVSATFQFVDLAGLHAPSAPFTLCFAVGAAYDTAGALPIPGNLRDAVSQLRLRVVEIGRWLGAGQTGRAADEAFDLRVLVVALPGLARADSAALGTRVQALNAAAVAADVAIVALHVAADLNDRETSLEQYGRFLDQLAIMDGLLPGSFACPMGCEKDRTYPAAGACPVCRMKLVDSRAHMDHEPRHGGVFMMSPDLTHHLEVALGSDGVLRLYAYDEYTRPIPVAGFRARVAPAPGTKAPGLGTSVRLSPSTDGASLAAPVSVRRPVKLQLTVDFGAGAGEETYDVEFAP